MSAKSRIVNFAAVAAMSGLIGGAALVLTGCGNKDAGTSGGTMQGANGCKGVNGCKGSGSCKADAHNCKGPNGCKAAS